MAPQSEGTLLERTTTNGHGRQRHRPQEEKKSAGWKLRIFLSVLALDAATAAILLNPFLRSIHSLEDDDSSHHYRLHAALWDLGVLAALRILSAMICLMRAYHKPDQARPSSSREDLFHRNGDRKTSSELEEEMLEEACLPQCTRFCSRNSFAVESVAFLTSLLLFSKCLARLNVEIGTLDEKGPRHVLYWISLALTGVWLLVETTCMDSMELLAAAFGKEQQQEATTRLTRNVMTQSLLAEEEESNVDEEQVQQVGSRSDTVRSDIGGDANYEAKWSDLLSFAAPDKWWILFASVFLILSAICNVFVPRLTGHLLDALVAHSSDNNSNNDDDGGTNGSIVRIPAFISNIERLVFVSILGGVCGGVRGAIFTVVGARVNVRLRLQLMDSLLSQEISFFEMTRTGDLTSRLSSDTTLVGSQVTTNVNIFLRSIVKAMGVLIFMFLISWQLSLLAFLTIPAVSVMSKWYGRYVRKLSKLQQKKLAEGNSVSEAAISSIATVRAFGAEAVELDEFETCMQTYLTLNSKASVATLGYSTFVQSIPQLVKALVLFYGGLLVQSDGPDHISGGDLVTFILFLTLLSESFNSLGGIFASLTRAVGAADKVFELMHRESRLKQPTTAALDDDDNEPAVVREGVLGHVASRTAQQCARGLRPDNCNGEIAFANVSMSYPSRPHHKVLKDLSLTIAPGSIVALVGASGSGKSSIIGLVQHLYDQTSGDIRIDNIPVHELCPDWLHREVSVVSQEPNLFARSIKSNIMYGMEGTDDEPTLDDIKEAAELANAHDFIEKLPFGYETDVGERGVQLSGGQKQRVAIARALIRKPKILLLDEATSALDSESEAVVQEAIDDLQIRTRRREEESSCSSSMTVVIVAHRLSTVKGADVIYVIHDGCVVEQGSHHELVQIKDGAYNALISRQITAQNKLK